MRVEAFTAEAILALAVACMPAAFAQSSCADSRDLRLVNGRIVTMDQRNTVAPEVTIQNGRIVSVGGAPGSPRKQSACTKTINLRGRTVVPGIIDNHNHVVLLGMRPGYDIRIETAASIADVQAALKARAKSVPKGAFITTLGDFNIKQFSEKRLPTIQELDAALPEHPYIMNGGGGTAVNSLAKTFFEGKGIAVSPAGAIAGGAPFNAALNALRAAQTWEDKKRGTVDAMNYMTGLGITTSSDMGAFALPGSPDMLTASVAESVESLNPWTMYDAYLALHREGKMTSRLRIFFLSQDTAPDVPILKQRLLNAFPDFGDDMLKISGIGEFAAAWNFGGRGAPPTTPANYETALKLVAAHGWAFQQHTLSLNEDQFTTATFEKVNAVMPIANLHWAIGHVPRIDRPTLDRLKAIGAGVAVHGWLYLSGTPQNGGPPFRTIVDSGIHVGAGSDAAAVSVFDPWVEMYYMVTGKNSAGEMINPGQQLTRLEALRLYTAANGWYTHEEDKLGTIELGKLGDLVVLSADYLDPKKVSDEEIKRIRSVMTVVDGKVVYDDLH